MSVYAGEQVTRGTLLWVKESIIYRIPITMFMIQIKHIIQVIALRKQMIKFHVIILLG